MAQEWTKREKTDFQRVLLLLGEPAFIGLPNTEMADVEIGAGKTPREQRWSLMQELAGLQRKSLRSIDEYFDTFMANCRASTKDRSRRAPNPLESERDGLTTDSHADSETDSAAAAAAAESAKSKDAVPPVVAKRVIERVSLLKNCCTHALKSRELLNSSLAGIPPRASARAGRRPDWWQTEHDTSLIFGSVTHGLQLRALADDTKLAFHGTEHFTTEVFSPPMLGSLSEDPALTAGKASGKQPKPPDPGERSNTDLIEGDMARDSFAAKRLKYLCKYLDDLDKPKPPPATGGGRRVRRKMPQGLKKSRRKLPQGLLKQQDIGQSDEDGGEQEYDEQGPGWNSEHSHNQEYEQEYEQLEDSEEEKSPPQRKPRRKLPQGLQEVMSKPRRQLPAGLQQNQEADMQQDQDAGIQQAAHWAGAPVDERGGRVRTNKASSYLMHVPRSQPPPWQQQQQAAAAAWQPSTVQPSYTPVAQTSFVAAQQVANYYPAQHSSYAANSVPAQQEVLPSQPMAPNFMGNFMGSRIVGTGSPRETPQAMPRVMPAPGFSSRGAASAPHFQQQQLQQQQLQQLQQLQLQQQQQELKQKQQQHLLQEQQRLQWQQQLQQQPLQHSPPPQQQQLQEQLQEQQQPAGQVALPSLMELPFAFRR